MKTGQPFVVKTKASIHVNQRHEGDSVLSWCGWRFLAVKVRRPRDTDSTCQHCARILQRKGLA